MKKSVALIIIMGVCLLAGFTGGPDVRADTTSGLKTCRAIILKDKGYFPIVLNAIDGAEREIVMSFFLFKTNGYKSSYPDQVLAHLIRAAQRGVVVKVLLEKGKDPSDMVDTSNRYTARRMEQAGIKVVFDSPRTTNHTKVAVIDRRYVIMGSHNLTNSALKYNHEISVLIESPDMAEDTLRYIDMLFK
jgi:phosphatidylserine/phosphatidylglycerophosphate/cardiolipin synthase-like enzyme